MKGALKAILWWEMRRILFNLAVLVAGLLTITIVEVVGGHFVKPGEDVEEPIGLFLIVILYAIAANVCYTFGWIMEIVDKADDSVKIEAERRKYFKQGIIFSIALTLSPAVLLPLLWTIFGAN